jgi:hypothetical protein
LSVLSLSLLSPRFNNQEEIVYRTLMRALSALCITSSALCFAQVVPGSTGHTFAATYKLSNIVEDGSQVEFTMTLTLDNPSGTDLRTGKIAVYDTQPSHTLISSIETLPAPTRSGRITVKQDFAISAEEFARWQQGHEPVLQYIAPTEDGDSVSGIQSHRVYKPGEQPN